MSALVPDPVPLDPPPGDPRALTDLAGRLDRAGGLLGELGEQVGVDAAAAPSWSGLDAAAARAQVERAGGLVREAADALLRAGGRVALHAELLEDAHGRLARLRDAQEEDFGAVAARLGGAPDDPGSAGALDELQSMEAARRRVADAIRAQVAEDAAATAVVLAECGAVAGGRSHPGDRGQVLRYLEGVLPGWHEMQLAQRGRDFAAAVRNGDAFGREAAARELLPEAGNGAVAVAVLTALGTDGFRDVLRQLGDGSLSAGSALARVMTAVLGAPVPPVDATAVARVRDGRLVDPDDYRSEHPDLVALGMGVLLAAARGDHRPGPPPATVREWGRQIVARERAMGSERIVDRVRLGPARTQPDPLQEVLARLARADDPAPAAALLRGQPTWTHLLDRSWDDGGAAFAALVARAAAEPGDVAVRSGLRALGAGLGDDGDPSGWTVDRATAAAIAPALADAVAARPDVVTGPLVRAAAGAEDDRVLLRGLGQLTTDPAAAGALDRAVAEVVGPLDGARPDPTDAAVAIAAGYPAVREYGQRLAHALDEFAAQERAEQRKHGGDLLMALGGRFVGPVAALAAVGWDLDGTWEAGTDHGQHFSAEQAVRAAGGAPAAGAAYEQVAGVLGRPTAPAPPPTDYVGLVTELVPGVRGVRDLPGGEHFPDVLDQTVDGVQELLGDEDDAGAGERGEDPAAD